MITHNNPPIGLDLLHGEELEEWWASIWRSRNLPDPATVTPAEFRAAIEQHRAETDT